MSFKEFLAENLRTNEKEATNVNFTATFIDEDADDKVAIKTINECLLTLHELGVTVSKTDDTGGERTYSSMVVDTDKIDDGDGIARAMKKATESVDHAVGFMGEFTFDGEEYSFYFKEDSDTTARTYFD